MVLSADRQGRTQKPEIIKLIIYICLIFVAYLPVSFAVSVTKRINTKLVPVLMILVMINFVLTIVFTCLGISDYHYMLKFSHANIVIAIFMTLYLIGCAAVKKTVEKDLIKRIVFGLFVAVVGVSIDMLRYFVTNGNIRNVSTFTRIGVLFFYCHGWNASDQGT